MLVVEQRGGALVLLEHLDHLFEELVPRVLDLPDLVLLVLAVLADDEDRIDRECLAAAPQRLRNGGVDLESELLRPVGTQVVLRDLIDVGGHDLDVRAVPLPLDRVAVEEPLGHVPGVTAVRPDGGDDRELLRRRDRLGDREVREESGGRGSEEGSAGEHWRAPHGWGLACRL